MSLPDNLYSAADPFSGTVLHLVIFIQ